MAVCPRRGVSQEGRSYRLRLVSLLENNDMDLSGTARRHLSLTSNGPISAVPSDTLP